MLTAVRPSLPASHKKLTGRGPFWHDELITGPLAGWAPNRGFHVERNLVLMLPSIWRGFMNLKRLILNRFPCCIGRFLVLQLRADAMRPRMTEQGIISSKTLCTGGT
jgi:hypothetical protein